MNKPLQTRVADIVQQRDLCSLMNNTKWSELVSAIISNMPFPPMYDIKYLTYDHTAEDLQRCDAWGNWTPEDFPPKEYYINIEWLKIQPRCLKYRGRLMGPEMIDASTELEAILREYHIPYEIEDGVYCIYGYR